MFLYLSPCWLMFSQVLASVIIEILVSMKYVYYLNMLYMKTVVLSNIWDSI